MDIDASRSKSRQSCQPLGQVPIFGIFVIFQIFGNAAILPSSKTKVEVKSQLKTLSVQLSTYNKIELKIK